MTGNVAAIVLAAGLSSRMGAFKPLLPLGPSTALEGVIRQFQHAGIGDIRVVTGHRSGELAPVIKRLGCRAVDNPRYQEGMFTSVVAGIASLESEATNFFVLPVDVPLVRHSTITRLLHASHTSTADVLYPVFMGERGHPPLIAGRLAGEIVSWQGGDGLRGALAHWENSSLDVEVADELILRDMDTPGDYGVLRERAQRLHVPTDRECEALLEKVLRVDECVVRHCAAVADVASLLGKELNRAGCTLDLPLLRAASMLHDLARHEREHARVGARMLAELGYSAVGELVASHMDLAFCAHDRVDGAAVLFLADKLVSGDRLVSLEERFQPALERHSAQPEVIGKVRARFVSARTIQQKLERIVGHSLTEIVAHHTSPVFSLAA